MQTVRENIRIENSVPIICHTCGTGSNEYGELFAKRKGWKGFSYVNVKLNNDEYRYERLGCCPACVGINETHP